MVLFVRRGRGRREGGLGVGFGERDRECFLDPEEHGFSGCHDRVAWTCLCCVCVCVCVSERARYSVFISCNLLF